MKKLIVIILQLSLILTTISTLQTLPCYADEINAKRCDVPSFLETWEPWNDDIVGYGSRKIENIGCALTCTAMVLKYLGVDTDPGRLNEWLKRNSGYSGDAIVWSQAAKIGYGTVKFITSEKFYGNLSIIKKEIDSGYPVIVKVNWDGNPHYVVITGYDGDTFYVNDPVSEDPSLTINERFLPKNNPAAAIQQIIIYHTTNHLPPKVNVVKLRSIYSPMKENFYVKGTPKFEFKIGSPYMNVNGINKEIDSGKNTSPIIIDGRTLIPMRKFIEEMGGNVEWNDHDQKVTVHVQQRHIEVWIGKRTAFVNGWFTELDVRPTTINDRTLVPLRFISENLGLKVGWDEATQTVIIYSS